MNVSAGSAIRTVIAGHQHIENYWPTEKVSRIHGCRVVVSMGQVRNTTLDTSARSPLLLAVNVDEIVSTQRLGQRRNDWSISLGIVVQLEERRRD